MGRQKSKSISHRTSSIIYEEKESIINSNDNTKIKAMFYKEGSIYAELMEIKKFLQNATEEEINFQNRLTAVNLVRIIRKPMH